FRIAVALQTQWRLGLALYFAGIRYRVGPLSKLHSFFVYNRGIRQHRSQVEMHEADYNLQLLRRLGVRVTARTLPTRIHISEDRIRDARKWLSEIGVVETEKLVAIHPGMGGSALNWPEEHFIELICQLARGGKQVLLT